MSTSFPLLPVSHGAPMFVIESGLAGKQLSEPELLAGFEALSG